MNIASINLMAALFAAAAAVLWARSAAVSLPRIASSDAAIASGAGINMKQMNDETHQLALAVAEQSRLSKWGAGCAAVAAALQAAGVMAG